MNFERIKEMAVDDLTQYRQLARSESGVDRSRAAAIGAVLHTLPEREQEVLRQFFIDRETRYAGHRARLQAMFDLSISELYRLKNQAITDYCLGLLAFKAAGGHK